MTVARIEVDGTAQFAVSGEGKRWVPVPGLGVDAPDLPALVERWGDVLAALEAGRGTPVEAAPRLLAPVVRPSKILAIGLNYLDHIRETGATPPERPVVFAKYPNAVTGPTDPIVVDARLTEQADYEVELAVVVGRRSRWLDEADALGAVFGYAVANDVSARDWQRRDAQFSRSKSMDTFCPIGPWITTADEVPDPQALRLRASVNGEPRQDSTTAQMLFGVAHLLAFLSRTMTLEPGDVLLTGTPPGVGFARRPPLFLQPGDTVRCEIDGLGAIENPVVAPPEPTGRS
jgi:5-carboxymethyl-2-hydroxymuconate isomerase